MIQHIKQILMQREWWAKKTNNVNQHEENKMFLNAANEIQSKKENELYKE